MASKWLNSILILLVAMQSLSAISDFHSFDQFTTDSLQAQSVDTPDLSHGKKHWVKGIHSSTDDTLNENQHCCHCHSLSLLLPTVCSLDSTLLNGELPEYLFSYQFDLLFPDLRPPIA